MTTTTQTTAAAVRSGRVAAETAVASGSRPRVLGVSLSDHALNELLVERPPGALSALEDIIDLTGAGVLYLGADRFSAPDAAPRTGKNRNLSLDPLFAAHSLLSRLPGAAVLVSTSPDVEHPFNYARRLLTLDHFTRGRIGTVVGTRDRRADRLSHGATPWTEEPTGPALTADFIGVLRELFNSWPRESIIVDKDDGRFADVSRIVRIDYEGHYSIAGPLSTPSSIQGEPPLGLHSTLGRAETTAETDAEFVVSTETAGVRLESSAPSGAGDLGFLARVDSSADLPTLVESLRDESAAEPAAGPRPPGTLRERLGLGPRSLDLSDRTVAFPT